MNEDDRIKLCRDLERLAFGKEWEAEHTADFDTNWNWHAILKEKLRVLGAGYNVAYLRGENKHKASVWFTTGRVHSVKRTDELLAFCLAARDALREYREDQP